MKILGGAKIKGGPKINPGAYPRIMTAGYSTFVPGVQQLLNNPITINGLSPLPLGIWLGVDGGGATWTSRQPTPGVALTLTGTTSDPVVDSSTPFFGDSLSSALRFLSATSKTYTGSTSFADLGTQDIVIEMVLAPVTGGGFPITKRDASGAGVGWRIYTNPAASQIQLQLSGPTGDRSVVGTLQGWSHLLVIADRSGSGIIYTNGSPGAALDISALVADNITIARAFALGGKYSQSDAAVTGILYVAIYMAQSWLDTHLQPTLASQRAQLVFGTRPQHWWGSFISPTAAGTSISAYLTHQESVSTTHFYKVDAGPERFQRVIASDNRVLTGAINEGAVQNEALYSLALGSWTSLLRCSIAATSVTCLDNIIRTTSTLHEDGTAANTHFIQNTSNITNGVPYVVSIFCKPVNRTWIALQTNTKYCYFQLSGNGVIGSSVGCTGHIKKIGTTGWYFCWISFTSTSTSGNPTIYVAEADNDITFDGLNQDSLYVTHVQIEQGVYPSQRVDTTTTFVTKPADNYYYTLAAGSLSDTEGSLLMRFVAPSDFVPASNKFLATLSVGALTTNTVSVFIDTNGRVNVTTTSTGGGSDAGSVAESSGTRCDGHIHEVKITWVHNSLKLYVDNVLIGEDTAVDPPVGLNRLRIGNDAANTAGLESGPIIIADVQAFASATNIRRVGF